MTNKQKIIKLYEQTYEVHPSYAEIAKKVGISRSRVYQVVQKYLSENRPAKRRISPPERQGNQSVC